MTYYIFIENGKTNGAGQAPQIDDGVINFEVTEQVFNAFIENPDKYIWNEDKQEIIENPNYEQEQALKKAVEIARLSLTRGDVFRGLLLAKGITKDQIASMIEAMPASNQEEIVSKNLAKIDFEDALNYYRGVKLIDTIGLALGISKEQLDNFFIKGNDPETKDEAYKELM